jgi:Tfp pilus assembly protein PilN
VKAVNLIPTESRRGGGEGASDVAVYGLLGGLALLLVAVTLYVLAAGDITQKKSDLAKAERDSSTAAAQLTALKPYADFAVAEKSRVSTVRQLAASRFDWDRTMGDLSRVVGKDVWLTGLQGTVAPGVSIDGGAGAGAGSTFRDALPGPAVSMTGCAISNQEVVRFVSRLRAMTGVTRVTLADAQKSDTATNSAGSGGSGADASGCGTDRWPQFDLIVSYEDLPTPTAATTADGSTSTASATGTAATGTTTTPATGTATTPTPASTTTPSGQ